MSQLVLVDVCGGVATVTLNRPEAMNALSGELMRHLVLAFREMKQDDSISVVIITGAGKAFCAGLDLKEAMAEGGIEEFSNNPDYDIQGEILSFDRPIIGAVNGVAATGGFELALWCDVLIASDKARFMDTHARIGLVPGWGLSQRLSRLVGVNRAREVSLTGNPLSAEKAERWGVVSQVVEHDELIAVCEQLAKDMLGCNREALIRYKRVINEGAGMDLASALKYERLALDLHST